MSTLYKQIKLNKSFTVVAQSWTKSTSDSNQIYMKEKKNAQTHPYWNLQRKMKTSCTTLIAFASRARPTTIGTSMHSVQWWMFITLSEEKVAKKNWTQRTRSRHSFNSELYIRTRRKQIPFYIACIWEMMNWTYKVNDD